MPILTVQQKKILIVASAALSCFAILCIINRCFEARFLENSEKLDSFPSPISSPQSPKQAEGEMEQPICPITLEPFKEPYYCIEDGHTYEKEAIIKWIQTTIKSTQDQGIHSDTVKSPASGIALKSFTLYPNKILFSKGVIPKDQIPIKFDIPQLMGLPLPVKTSKCLFDSKIRSLIEDYVNVPHPQKNLLKQKIHERRLQLNLAVDSAYPLNPLDLSYLDLSNMKLKRLELKGAILKESNFSKTILENCILHRCQFLSCQLQETVFINCYFAGEQVSFLNSDLKNAVFQSHNYCALEIGASWGKCGNWHKFKAELKTRGALNVDTIECYDIPEN